jgi:hypothetical protein
MLVCRFWLDCNFSCVAQTNCISFGSLDDLPAEQKGAARDLLGQIKGFFDFDFEEDSLGKGLLLEYYVGHLHQSWGPPSFQETLALVKNVTSRELFLSSAGLNQ